MRRVGETPNGLNEALVCRALEVARSAAVPEVSLNYAGLAHLVRQPPSGGRAGRLAARVARETAGQALPDAAPGHVQRQVLPAVAAALPRVRVAPPAAARRVRVLQAEGYLGTGQPANGLCLVHPARQTRPLRSGRADADGPWARAAPTATASPTAQHRGFDTVVKSRAPARGSCSTSTSTPRRSTAGPTTCVPAARLHAGQALPGAVPAARLARTAAGVHQHRQHRRPAGQPAQRARVRPMIMVFPDGRIGGSTYSDSEWANTSVGRLRQLRGRRRAQRRPPLLDPARPPGPGHRRVLGRRLRGDQRRAASPADVWLGRGVVGLLHPDPQRRVRARQPRRARRQQPAGLHRRAAPHDRRQPASGSTCSWAATTSPAPRSCRWRGRCAGPAPASATRSIRAATTGRSGTRG